MHISPYVFVGIPEFKKEGLTDIEQIVRAVEKEYGRKILREYTKSRKREILEPRQMVVVIARKYTRLSLKDLGQLFGGYDHTSIIHSAKAIQNLIDTNEQINRKYNNIKTSLNIT